MERQDLKSSKPQPLKEGMFTRSKSQTYSHQNRSGRVRLDTTRSSPSYQNFQKLYPTPKKRKNSYLQQPEEALLDVNDGSRNLRVRRVFSTSSVIEQNGESSELGLKSASVDSSGNGCAEMIGMVLEDLKRDLEKGEADLGLENHGFDRKVGADEEPIKVASKEAIENRETGQPPVKFIRPYDSSTTNKAVVKPGLLRRVFKTSSSFSYRRLLPFLMSLEKDDSCASEIEFDDTGLNPEVQNMNNVKPNSSPDNSNCNASKNEPTVADSDDSKPLARGEIDNLGISSPCKQTEKNCGNLHLAQTEVNSGLHSVDTMRDNILNGIDDVMGDDISMTPPDPDIFSKFDLNDYKASTDQSAQQIENNVLGNPSNGRCRSNNAFSSKQSYQNPSERNGSSWKTKMVLNPCSRKKVLKPPNSVMYRRLLPYLMDVAKDNKDQPNILESKDSNPPNSQASTANNASEVHTSNLSVAMSSSTSDSAIEKPILAPSEDITEPIISYSPEMDGTPQVEHILSDTTKQLEPDLANNDRKENGEVPSSPIANAESSPKMPEISQLEAANCEVGDIQAVNHEDSKHVDERDVSDDVHSNTSTFAGIHTVVPTETLLNESSVWMEADCQEGSGNLVKESTSDESSTPIEESSLPVVHTVGHAETLIKDCKLATLQSKHFEENYINNGALIQTVTINKVSSEVQASNHSVTQTDGTMKGVLRRNPRGCRGRCDCLNCTSFRLHAERAFEFSKHQMQDAEEVALELIKELSDIRKFLENAASKKNNLAAFEPTQVKEARTKALQAEQLAKERLVQMNDELHYHCRITPLQRPRVTFSVSTTDRSTRAKNTTDNKRKRNRNS
ncbi:PREDICTED: uncharacterized protein LOC109175196 [Ipomoea nil]|uniref:uncharacterized protein LOC109175196 n=1 Tax=Ipomoea nil TaxID=35883 RepID=UPI000900CD26|nr:PREDICTED: uncharacterized protein LOC109175196 [Ipomoea nil]